MKNLLFIFMLMCMFNVQAMDKKSIGKILEERRLMIEIESAELALDQAIENCSCLYRIQAEKGCVDEENLSDWDDQAYLENIRLENVFNQTEEQLKNLKLELENLKKGVDSFLGARKIEYLEDGRPRD